MADTLMLRHLIYASIIHDGWLKNQADHEKAAERVIDMLQRGGHLATHPQVIDKVDAADFEQWWQSDGQFSRAGGGDYEKTFAFNAWRAALAATGEGQT